MIKKGIKVPVAHLIVIRIWKSQQKEQNTSGLKQYENECMFKPVVSPQNIHRTAYTVRNIKGEPRHLVIRI